MNLDNIQYILFISGILFTILIIYSIALFKSKILNFIFDTFVNISFLFFIFYIVRRWALKEIIYPVIISFVIGILYYFTIKRQDSFLLLKKKKHAQQHMYNFYLESEDGKKIIFTYPFDNFLIYAGAGAGKTKWIGKPLLKNYIEAEFAGFIYDYKDFDYTKTAYNFVKKCNYPYKFYYLSFTDMSRTYRCNPLKPSVVADEDLLLQIIEDIFASFKRQDSKDDEWYAGALGVFQAVALRFYLDFPEICTLPHILNFIVHSSRISISDFIKNNEDCIGPAKGFLEAQDSERTQASIMFTLANNLGKMARNKRICYVLSGDDFDMDLIDPKEPKLLSVCNSYSIDSIVSPIIACLLSLSTRKFTLSNKIPCMYLLDEATTFKVADFEKMPSVLREYLASFVFLTQSGSKIEKLYGKVDRNSIESNFGNLFIGKTNDVEALKHYSEIFGKEEVQRKSHTRGTSGNHDNRSTTVSTQKEERYERKFFTDLQTGEFAGKAAHSNMKDFHMKLKMYDSSSEEDLPIVRTVLASDIEENYRNIIMEVKSII